MLQLIHAQEVRTRVDGLCERLSQFLDQVLNFDINDNVDKDGHDHDNNNISDIDSNNDDGEDNDSDNGGV